MQDPYCIVPGHVWRAGYVEDGDTGSHGAQTGCATQSYAAQTGCTTQSYAARMAATDITSRPSKLQSVNVTPHTVRK